MILQEEHGFGQGFRLLQTNYISTFVLAFLPFVINGMVAGKEADATVTLYSPRSSKSKYYGFITVL